MDTKLESILPLDVATDNIPVVPFSPFFLQILGSDMEGREIEEKSNTIIARNADFKKKITSLGLIELIQTCQSPITHVLIYGHGEVKNKHSNLA